MFLTFIHPCESAASMFFYAFAEIAIAIAAIAAVSARKNSFSQWRLRPILPLEKFQLVFSPSALRAESQHNISIWMAMHSLNITCCSSLRQHNPISREL